MADGGVPALPPPLPGGELGIGHPLAESQRAGIDYLIRIAMEQAAARRCDRDETTEAYGHI